jgi:hypothetical protein
MVFPDQASIERDRFIWIRIETIGDVSYELNNGYLGCKNYWEIHE